MWWIVTGLTLTDFLLTYTGTRVRYTTPGRARRVEQGLAFAFFGNVVVAVLAWFRIGWAPALAVVVAPFVAMVAGSVCGKLSLLSQPPPQRREPEEPPVRLPPPSPN